MKIGFFGVGHMGGPMAANLVKAGHEVAAFDLVPALLAAAVNDGVKAAESAAEAVQGADVIVSMLPSAAAVRPARCLACGHEGAAPGHPLGLHGHGKRARLQLGPPDLFAPPELTEVLVRRYQCQRCAAITMVAPRDVLAFVRYRASAVVMALAYLAEGRASPWIREQVSPDRVLGHEGRRAWRSPSRWASPSTSWRAAPRCYGLRNWPW